MKIAFIGGGNMAHALIGGLVKRGIDAAGILAIDPTATAREKLAEAFGIATADAPDERLADYEVVLLAVKPQVLRVAAEALAPHLGKQLIISIAAGIRATDIARWLGGYTHIVRAMPNTPALIGQGVTGLAALPGVEANGRQLAQQIMEAVGQVVWCNAEGELDAVTAISGSGPAYVFYFIEALQQAARELGLDDAQGRTLALATVAGAAQLAVQASEPAGVLRERVTSKGGTTAAALQSFEADAVGAAIVRAARAAHARSRQLGDELGAS
jgi:pyrroline-5-carboxylate reductase